MLAKCHPPFFTFLLGISIASSEACLWDRDTITDELQTRTTQYDLVMGQFPSHGDAYYQQRIKNLGAESSLSLEDKNDLAVAYTRTRQYTRALALLMENLSDKPNHYASLSNIGVTYKKMGDYQKATDYMAKALKIKPEGHMGLGDWYLKRLQWSNQYESPGKPTPKVNFLGEDYSKTGLRYLQKIPNTPERTTRATLLTKLIKNDRHFPDVYVVLGDFLIETNDLNLAMRCYAHALHLKHPNKEIIHQRIRFILSHWGMRSQRNPISNDELQKMISTHQNTFEKELKQSEQWLTYFHEAEANLITSAKLPTFDETAATLTTKRFRPIPKKTSTKVKNYRR